MVESESLKIEISEQFYKKLIESQQDEIDSLKKQIAETQFAISSSASAVDSKDGTDIEKEYSEYKTNGIRKARKADSIRSYDDFKNIQDYFLNKGQVRNYTLWTLGVALGLRISDLTKLRYKHFLLPDMETFRERTKVYEQKTGKLNDMLITEACRNAINILIHSGEVRAEYDDFIFANPNTGAKIDPKSGWRIISTAGRDLGLPIVCSSHTMRKSFANIAACVDTSVVDMNSVTKIQGLLNHSDPKTTMRYLGTYKDMYDRARIAVSDFILGRSDMNELIAGTSNSVQDIMEKMEELESLIVGGR